MNYLVFKSDFRREFRLYIDGNEVEGQIIYKGHKLGVEVNLLSQLIDFRIERSTNKISFLQYDKITEGVTLLDKNIWKISIQDSFDKNILESWDSLLRASEKKFGKFRKILITAVNI
jgi:hypothetical protein